MPNTVPVGVAYSDPDLSALYIGGVQMTSSAAELNVLAGVAAGTTSASKALVVGANKNLDTLVIAASGLKIGAGAGTAMTASAAELNVNAGVTAGTVTANKTLVVDANKALDTLNIVTPKWGAGAGTTITATAAQLNQIGPAFGAVAFDRATKIARVALAAVDTGGGIFAWQNPEAVDVIVSKVVIDVTTKTTGACSIDVGYTATNATTQSDTIIDGLDIGTATGCFSTGDQAGANGKIQVHAVAGKWVTGSKDSGASAGIVGFAYIYYNLV